MKLNLIAIVFFLVLATDGHATMPLLTDEPKPATLETCRIWADKQSQDAIDMWGVQEDGTYSDEVALERLYQKCLGYEPPEIVGFESSIGFNITYCEMHPTQKICDDFKAYYCKEHPEEKLPLCENWKP
jgi:hypothetical protein